MHIWRCSFAVATAPISSPRPTTASPVGCAGSSCAAATPSYCCMPSPRLPPAGSLLPSRFSRFSPCPIPFFTLGRSHCIFILVCHVFCGSRFARGHVPGLASLQEACSLFTFAAYSTVRVPPQSVPIAAILPFSVQRADLVLSCIVIASLCGNSRPLLLRARCQI